MCHYTRQYFGDELKDERVQHVVRKGEVRSAYRILVRERKGKKPLGRPEIKIISENHFKELWFEFMCVRIGVGDGKLAL
jgi:hypothetical protein